MMDILTDADLLESLKAGGAKRQKAITQIYQDKQLKTQVISFVKNNGGNAEDGIDIFHEGIIALDENVRKDRYTGAGKLQGYLFSTCRFLWLNRFKRDKRTVLSGETADFDQASFETPESLSLGKEQQNILDNLLGQLGEKCQKILTLWKLSYSMEEIATQVGLQDAGVARRQRYVCYEKLLQIVDNQPNLRNILK